MSAEQKPDALALAQEALDDLKAQDVKLLDVQSLTALTDHMLICTGTSGRHVNSIAENLVQHAKKNGLQPLGVEGREQSEWVLVDLGAVVVHIMQAQIRAFYQLEKLWSLDAAERAENGEGQDDDSEDE